MRSKLYDISPPLDEFYAVWPSDTPLAKKERLKLEKGHSINLSAFEATAHLGAHLNSPLITDPKGLSVGEMDLEMFLGLCQVIEVEAKPSEKIMVSQIKDEIKAPRVLFKTSTAERLHPFVEDYAALDSSLVEFLHQQKVCLIGIDTPGVDLYTDCQKVFAQKAASHYKIGILECLQLKGVPPGLYELIALPLKLVGFEASPVRAILRTI